MAESNAQPQSSSARGLCDNNDNFSFSDLAPSPSSAQQTLSQTADGFVFVNSKATDSFFSFTPNPSTSASPLPSSSPFHGSFCANTTTSTASDPHLTLPTPSPWTTINLSPFHSTSMSASSSSQIPFSLAVSASTTDILPPPLLPTPSFSLDTNALSVAEHLPSSAQSSPTRITERSGSNRSVHSLESHESSRSDSGGESAKSKRSQIQRACVHCRRHKTRCDEQRPCGRCSRLGRASTCVDFVPAKSRYTNSKKKATTPKDDSPKSLNLNMSDLRPFASNSSSSSSSPAFTPAFAYSPPPVSTSQLSSPSINPSPLLVSSLSQSLLASTFSGQQLPLSLSQLIQTSSSLPSTQPSQSSSSASTFMVARRPWFELMGPMIQELDKRAKAAESPLPLDIVTAMAWLVGYARRRVASSRPLEPTRTSNNSDPAPISSSVAALDLLKTDLTASSSVTIGGPFDSSLSSLIAPVSTSIAAHASSFALLSSLSSSTLGLSPHLVGRTQPPSSHSVVSISSPTHSDALEMKHWMPTRERSALSTLNDWRITHHQIDSILQGSQQKSCVEQIQTRFEREKTQLARVPFGVVLSPLYPSGPVLVWANEYMASLLGSSQSQLNGLLSEDPSRVFTAASRDRVDARICRMILHGEAFATFPVTAIAANGDEVQMMQSVSIKGIDGIPLYAVSFFQLKPIAGGMAVGNAFLHC